MTQAKSTDPSFRIDVTSPAEFDELVAEIYIHDEFVGLLSQESGPGHTVLELGPIRGDVVMKLDLAVFEEALNSAKARLQKLPKREQRSDDE